MAWDCREEEACGDGEWEAQGGEHAAVEFGEEGGVDGVEGGKFDWVGGADGWHGWVGVVTDCSKAVVKWVGGVTLEIGFWCRIVRVKGIGR